MADHPSALKRQRQSEKRHARNKGARSGLKTLRKKIIAAKTKTEAQKNLLLITSALHKAVHKGVMHQNAAARRISRLTQFVNHLN